MVDANPIVNFLHPIATPEIGVNRCNSLTSNMVLIFIVWMVERINVVVDQ